MQITNTKFMPLSVNVQTVGRQAHRISASTLKKLRQAVHNWQEIEDVGSKDWMPSTVFKGKHAIGTMSYNGRIWVNGNTELVG